MEADMVRKKYDVILEMLKKERESSGQTNFVSAYQIKSIFAKAS
jgi:hypothetical protein